MNELRESTTPRETNRSPKKPPKTPAKKPQYFGTDGMRGKFGRAPLDEPTVRRLGAALGRRLIQDDPAASVVLGGDTRESTPILCSWLVGELQAEGVTVTYLGTMTTPGVTATVRRLDATAGIAVSASHNPHPDNGIKLIDGDGFKWEPGAEAELEALMESIEPDGATHLPEVDQASVEAYITSLSASLDGRRLDGMRIVLDAGFGAASPFAETLFSGLGADVTVLHDAPTGRNINLDSGSTHPEALCEHVARHGADLGVAFDGDADRAVLVDDQGELRDGDAILFLWALDLKARGALPGDALVATSMSNLGLQVALAPHGIGLERCGVGDREVVATMRSGGFVLGGEQSGHIVHLDLSTTGDGLLTALQLADMVARKGRPLSELLAEFRRFPQLLRNLPVRHKPALDSLPDVMAVSREVEAELGDQGRLVLRYSGTEDLVRIMIEGPDRDTIDGLADRLEVVLTAALG